MNNCGHDRPPAAWRKSTRSGSGNCLETAPFTGGIAVRDSADRDGPALAFTARAWTAFTTALETGMHPGGASSGPGVRLITS